MRISGGPAVAVGIIVASAGVIYYVHKSKELERYNMRLGVYRDMDRLAEERAQMSTNSTEEK